MNQIQIMIIGVFICVLLLLMLYFWYQEKFFTKQINKLTIDDFEIKNNNSKAVIHKNDDNNSNNAVNIDINKNYQYPEDSMEIIFAKIHDIPFNHKDSYDFELDYVIDIAFESITKINILPKIIQFTQKSYQIFVLDKYHHWVIYKENTNYQALAVKYIIMMVDKDGLINKSQIINIYNELFKFIINKNAHIMQSNYEPYLQKLYTQFRFLKDIPLDLQLYLVFQNSVTYNDLIAYFTKYKLSFINNKLHYIVKEINWFSIADEQNNGLIADQNYTTLTISSQLHFLTQPEGVIDYIMDIFEECNKCFEVRLLTSNKQIFSQKEYISLKCHINNYINNAKKVNIILGGNLINRVCERAV